VYWSGRLRVRDLAARWPAACLAGCCRAAPKMGDRSADCLAGRCSPQAEQVDYSPADGLAARSLAALRSAEAYSPYCSVGHSAEHSPDRYHLRDPDARCSAVDLAGCPHRSAVEPAAHRAGCFRGALKMGGRFSDCLAGRCWPEAPQVDYSPADGLVARSLAALRSAEAYSPYC